MWTTSVSKGRYSGLLLLTCLSKFAVFGLWCQCSSHAEIYRRTLVLRRLADSMYLRTYLDSAFQSFFALMPVTERWEGNAWLFEDDH